MDWLICENVYNYTWYFLSVPKAKKARPSPGGLATKAFTGRRGRSAKVPANPSKASKCWAGPLLVVPPFCLPCHCTLLFSPSVSLSFLLFLLWASPSRAMPCARETLSLGCSAACPVFCFCFPPPDLVACHSRLNKDGVFLGLGVHRCLFAPRRRDGRVSFSFESLHVKGLFLIFRGFGVC